MAGQCGRICRSWGGSIRMGIMIDIQDFESCETSGQFYGGNAGRKIGLVWRAGDWLVKFPGTTRNLQGSVPSYTTAPVSNGWDPTCMPLLAYRFMKRCWESVMGVSSAPAGTSPSRIPDLSISMMRRTRFPMTSQDSLRTRPPVPEWCSPTYGRRFTASRFFARSMERPTGSGTCSWWTRSSAT